MEKTKYVILIPSGWTNKQLGSGIDAWEWLETNYSGIANHLLEYEKDARKRHDQGEYWWELRSCAYYEEFEQSKIMLPDISLKGNFTFDANEGFYCVNTAYIIPKNDKYLLGILNSKLISFIYKNLSPAYRGGYLRFIYQYLAILPIRTIDFDQPEEKALHDKLVGFVETMLELHEQLPDAPEGMKQILEQRIAKTDHDIDQLVYELYGLSDEEIAIVEA